MPVDENEEVAIGPDPVVVLCPAIEVTKREFRPASRPGSLEGSALGVLCNRKRSADVLLEEVGAILARDYRMRPAVSMEKRSSSRLAQPELFERIVDDCDVAISGVGDCGSSASFTVYDALEIERNGMPAAVVVTEALRFNAAATAERLGAPDYLFATVPHPIASLSPNELRQAAAEVAPLVARILLGKHAT